MLDFRFIRHNSFLICAVFFGLSSCNKDLSQLKQSEQKALIEGTGAQSLGTNVKSDKEKAAFFRWLFAEMYQQVFLKPPVSTQDELAWVSVLRQGGSIEGVYHGLILSTDYRALEVGVAKPAALRFFCQELVLIKNDKGILDDKLQKEMDSLVKENLGTSLFTFKRELGELLLSEIEKRKSDRQSLAQWYAKLAARWSNNGIDFGLPQRMSKDVDFHLSWAQNNSLGLIQWEILNRALRSLNHFGGAVPDKK